MSAAHDPGLVDPTHPEATAPGLEAAPQNTPARQDPDPTHVPHPRDEAPPHEPHPPETEALKNHPIAEPQPKSTPIAIAIAGLPPEAEAAADHTPIAPTLRDLAPHLLDPDPVRPDHAPVDPGPKQYPLAATPNPPTRPGRAQDPPDPLTARVPTHLDPRDTRQDPTHRAANKNKQLDVVAVATGIHAPPERKRFPPGNRPIQPGTASPVDPPESDRPAADLALSEALPGHPYLQGHAQGRIADADEAPFVAAITATSLSLRRHAAPGRSAHRIRSIQRQPYPSHLLSHSKDAR